MLKFEDLDFEVYLKKAHRCYLECVFHEDNVDDFREEADIDLILIRNDSVSVEFRDYDMEHYYINVKITLYTEQEPEVGYYRYIEDNNGEFDDEFLVFY